MQDERELTDEFCEEALGRAREYGKRLSPNHACDMCAELELRPEQDEKIKQMAGWKIDDGYKPFFRKPPQPPTEDHRWFFSEEIFPAVREAFREHAADPEQCELCLDDSIECAHERHDPDGCPV